MKTFAQFLRIAGPLLAVLLIGVYTISVQRMPSAGAIASASIAVMAIVYYAMFWLETRQAFDGITRFEAAIAKGAQTVGSDVPMAAAFNDYLKNLVGDPKSPNRLSRLPADEYLNQRSLLESRMNLPFYQSLPNILVGVGILFTFLGLAMALQAAGEGVTAADPTKMRESLNELFRAASFKFITSIFGLGCSMIFAIAEKHRLHQFSDRLKALCAMLDKRFAVFRFEEALLREVKAGSNPEASRALAEAAQAMQGAAEGLGTQLAAMAGLQRSLTPEAIGQQVGMAMQGVITDHLTPVFQEIRVELSQLREIKADQGQEILANLVKELRVEVLEPIAERLDQSAQLTREASEAVRTLSQDLDRVTLNLKETTQSIETFQNNTLERLQQFAQSLRDILAQFSGETRGVLQAVATEVHNVVGESLKGLDAQRAAFESSAQSAAATFGGLRGDIERAMHAQLDAQKTMLLEVQTQMEGLVGRSDETLRTTAGAFEQVISHSTEALSQQREAFRDSAQETVSTFRQVREDLVASLGEQTAEQAKMLTAQVEAQHTMLQEVQTQMEGLVDRSDETLRGTASAFEGVIAQSVGALGDQRTAFQESADETVKTFRQVREDLVSSLEAQSAAQRHMLQEVNGQMGAVLADANQAFRGTTDAIRQAVEAGVESMEAQREAFGESAADARDTFRGIREELEAALRTQAALEAERLDAQQGRTRELLDRVEASFQEQMRTLSGVGGEAAALMNSARENLVAGLSDIQAMMGRTSETVRQELENFRVNYQGALTDFFNEQNNLLEGTLGEQREGLAAVVLDLQRTFRDEAQGRARMSAEVDAAAGQLLGTLERLEQFSAAVGLTTGERVLGLQELARETGQQARRVEDAYRGLVGQVQQAMDASNEQLSRYLAHGESREKQFFSSYDEAVAKLTDGLMEVAEYLAQAEEHRREAIKS